jgi:hypothetical protein
MVKNISLMILLSICFYGVKGQQTIVYRYEQRIVDSLRSGITFYERMYHKPAESLRLYAMVSESNGNTEIYLQEYSPIHLKGLLDVIKSTNRRIRISEGYFIPVIFPCDIHSTQIQGDKIEDLPFTGFYIKVNYEKHKVKDIQTAILF